MNEFKNNTIIQVEWYTLEFPPLWEAEARGSKFEPVSNLARSCPKVKTKTKANINKQEKDLGI